MPDTPRRIRFEHDGHRFEGVEEARPAARGVGRELHWVVRMDGEPVLEFRGAYPYRDDDVRARVLEWYAIQRPRGRPAPPG